MRITPVMGLGDDALEVPQPVETRLRDGAGMEVVGTLRTAGRTSGVVVVPGILCWRGLAEIDAVAASLARAHDVLCIDVRGHGDSEGRFTWGREEWRQVDAAATHLAAGGRRVTVVGFSFGGFHAAMAASAGAPIDRLALVSAPVDFRFLDHFVLGPALWRHVPLMIRRERRRVRLEWPTGLRSRTMAPADLTKIRARTLVVHGGKDWIMSRRHAETYTRHIAGATLLEIPGGLHAEFLVRSHGDRILGVLGEFCGPVA